MHKQNNACIYCATGLHSLFMHWYNSSQFDVWQGIYIIGNNNNSSALRRLLLVHEDQSYVMHEP